jgi:predicted enzyme related to lactoylglutathione lyase
MTGRFVWYELMTTDTKNAIAFYTEVVGWKTELFKESEPGKEPYNMWVASQGPLGGVMTLPDEVKKMGVPPHWMAHVEVDDVDATVAKVKKLGGKVLAPPMDIPTVGRFSVIADPQGASLSVFKPLQSMTAHDTTKPGEASWHELYANDHQKVLEFYYDLFGWKKLSEMDMGPPGKYTIFGQGEKQYGGAMNITAEMKMPPSWAYYFNVDDLDAALERAKKRDAKVMFGPMEVPGGTRVAMLTDPQGAVFALHEPKKS